MGRTGTLCDQMAAACESHPCQNGGHCVPLGSTFKCL